MTTFDFSVLAFIAVIGLLGLSVGFIKGGLWLACWVGAAFATLYGYAYIEPIAVPWLKSRNLINQPLLADMAVGVGIFFVSLIFLFMVSSVVTGWIRTSRLNALDRSLGLLAGLIAGCLIVFAAYIPLKSTWPREEDQPSWLREAKLHSMIEWGASMLQGILPADLGGTRSAANPIAGPHRAGDSDPAYRALARPPQPATEAETNAGYTTRERDDMNRLLQSGSGQ